jgi:hypothetical protein
MHLVIIPTLFNFSPIVRKHFAFFTELFILLKLHLRPYQIMYIVPYSAH